MKLGREGKRVIIDAGNLRHGGGVQVAASFLDQLSLLRRSSAQPSYEWLDDISIEVSCTVLENLSPESREDLPLITVHGRGYRLGWASRGSRPEVEFSVFGPAYGLKRAHSHVLGFADVTSIYPAPNGVKKLTGIGALKSAARARVSLYLFERADRLVVETAAIRARLIEVLGYPPERIDVVPNTCNQVFINPSLDPGLMTAIRRKAHGLPSFAYVSRAYPHKNLEFLGKLGQVMEVRHGLVSRFVVTLRESEFSLMSPLFKNYAVNVGPLTIDRVPTVYAASDYAIFPSLLESFSATPLEALAMRRPLFASNRDFVRDIVGDAATYFDPLCAMTAADVVVNALADATRLHEQVCRGEELVAALPTPVDRAQAYLEIVDRLM